jgi:indole-3-acetate monooxygenase
MTAAIIEQIQAHGERITELGKRAEQERRLPDELVKILTDLGLFHIYVPKAYDGLELSVIDGLKIIEEVSALDPATGWCLLKGSSTNQMSGNWSPELAAEVMTGRDIVVAGSLNPRGIAVKTDSGYRLNGHWDWGTATSFSQWVIAGAKVMEADGVTPAPGPPMIFVVPSKYVTLVDTWDTYGMRGTASNDFTITDADLPAHYAVPAGPPAHNAPGDLFKVPGFMWMTAPHAAVSIGIASGCVAATMALAVEKTPLMSSTLLKDKVSTRDAIGRATALVRSSRSYLFESVNNLWAADMPTPDLGLHVHLASTHAVHAAVQAVDLCNSVAGGSSVYSKSPIQRYFRDAHVAATHYLVNVDKFAAAGRVLLGDAFSMMQP